MNSSQRFGLFILILISVLYIYFSFLSGGVKLPEFNNKSQDVEVYNPMDNNQPSENNDAVDKKKNTNKTVKIFLIDNSGKLRSVNRNCDASQNISCFEYTLKALLSAPTKYEKSMGFVSEIPQGTKLLSLRESAGSVLVDLSSEFESGGGAESTYLRLKQVIKTVNSNTSTPVYLYINGKQADVIGGEGVMIKQPLNERSLDE